MNKCFYIYNVQYWDDLEEKEATANGIVYGKNYGNAIEKVMKDYGEECVLSVKATEITSDNTLELDEEITMRILEGGYR